MQHRSRDWLHLYKTARWRRLRHYQLSMHPLCAWCLERGEVTEANEVHHVRQHKGDLELFWNGPFISTCKSCHSSRGKLEDHGKTVVVYGEDGWPL